MTTTAFPVQLTKKHLILHRYLHEAHNDTCSCCNVSKIYAPYKDVPQEPQTGHEVNAASTETDITPSSLNSPANYIEDNTHYGFQQEKHTSSHSDEDYEDEEEEDDDDYEYVGSGMHPQVISSTTQGKKRVIVSSNSTSSRKPTTATMQHTSSTASSTEQVECCLLNCHNPCSNRLRFSLKSLELTHFKPDFLEKDWNRICNYCYFHTLYTFKKQMASHQQNSSGDEASTTARKRRNSGAKRPRKEATSSSMFTALPSISAEYKPSSEEEESTFIKKARNV